MSDIKDKIIAMIQVNVQEHGGYININPELPEQIMSLLIDPDAPDHTREVDCDECDNEGWIDYSGEVVNGTYRCGICQGTGKIKQVLCKEVECPCTSPICNNHTDYMSCCACINGKILTPVTNRDKVECHVFVSPEAHYKGRTGYMILKNGDDVPLKWVKEEG